MKNTKFITIFLTIYCHPFLCLALNCTFDDYNVQTGEWQPISNNSSLLLCNGINTVCSSEPFNHTYLYTGNVSKPFQNEWKPAKLWEKTDLKEPCLRDDGTAVTRKCVYDPKQRSAAWEELNESMTYIICIKDTKQKFVTNDLNKLEQAISEETTDKTLAAKKLVNILEEPAITLVPADIQLISTIVKQITKDNRDTEILEDIVKIGSNLLDTQLKILQKSDIINATNAIRLTFEMYLIQLSEILMAPDFCDNNKYGTLKAFQHSMSVLLINPLCANISGVALYRKDNSVQNIEMHYDPVTKYHYRFLNMNQSPEEFLNDHSVLLAAYFPYTLWSKLLELRGNAKNDMILIYELYGYFVDSNDKHQIIESPVLNIKIKNFRGDLPEDLRFVLPINENKTYDKPKCVYWNGSQWTFDGVTTVSDDTAAHGKTKTIICSTNHLTSFGISLGMEMRHETDRKTVLSVLVHENILYFITVFGCSLSLFGLLVIWLTGLFSKSWREINSHKIVMNLCIPLTLLMLFFLMCNVKVLRDSHCLAMASFLHYTILVLFIWMLSVACRQYQRSVVVITDIRKHYIVISAIAAWTIPLVPTVLVALLGSPKLYEISDEFEICFPTGNALYYGVIMPIAGIVVANLFILICIIFSFVQAMIRCQKLIDRQRIIRLIYFSILYFFLFGLPWIFGIFALLNDMLWYLFCLTSTLQGFILFVYFIILNDTAQTAWTNCLYIIIDPKKYFLELRSLPTTYNINSTNNNRDPSSKYPSVVAEP